MENLVAVLPIESEVVYGARYSRAELIADLNRMMVALHDLPAINSGHIDKRANDIVITLNALTPGFEPTEALTPLLDQFDQFASPYRVESEYGAVPDENREDPHVLYSTSESSVNGLHTSRGAAPRSDGVLFYYAP